jgi:ornithine carbamoyltransferase
MQDFISLDDLNPRQFSDLLTVAVYLKKRKAAGITEHALAGKTLAMVFEKPSLRTRMSFEVAMTDLGGVAMYIRGDEVGLNTREPVCDVARVLSRYVHGIMLRTFGHANVIEMAKHANIPVINGLSDYCHPCQALADFLTIKEHFGRIDQLRVVFIGDANNVCRSLARACVLAGSQFVLACPKAYGFSKADQERFGAAWGKTVIESNDPGAAVAGSHVLYSDVWTSMGQEAEREKRLAAFQGYQINASLLKQARADAKIMHCLPAHRGEEVTAEAFESPASIVFDQAENRLHAQKAILRLLMANDADKVLLAAQAASSVSSAP